MIIIVGIGAIPIKDTKGITRRIAAESDIIIKYLCVLIPPYEFVGIGFIVVYSRSVDTRIIRRGREAVEISEKKITIIIHIRSDTNYMTLYGETCFNGHFSNGQSDKVRQKYSHSNVLTCLKLSNRWFFFDGEISWILVGLRCFFRGSKLAFRGG